MKFIFLVLFSCYISIYSQENRLVSFHNTILFAYYNNDFFEVVRSDDPFYGFGWIDSNRVLVAIQDPNIGGAEAIINAYNLDDNSVKKLFHVSGSGESRFEINNKTGLLIYNSANDIHLVKIDTNLNIESELIEANVYGFNVFWINEKEYGYSTYINGKPIFIKRTIPKKGQ